MDHVADRGSRRILPCVYRRALCDGCPRGWMLGGMIGGLAAWALLQWPRFRKKVESVVPSVKEAGAGS